MKTKERYIHIDILRAIAILGVMLGNTISLLSRSSDVRGTLPRFHIKD